MQRAAVVVEQTDDDKMSDLVWRIAETYGDETVTAVAWSQVEELPDWVSVNLQDQLSAYRRDTEGAVYMIVWLGSDEEIEELTED